MGRKHLCAAGGVVCRSSMEVVMKPEASFPWLADLNEAEKLADEQGKLVLVDFFSPT